MIHFSDWEFGLPRQHRGPVTTGLQATVKTLNAPLLPPRHRGLITAPPRLVNPCSIRPGSTLRLHRAKRSALAWPLPLLVSCRRKGLRCSFRMRRAFGTRLSRSVRA